MSKFLDSTGLGTLWAKIKSTFQTLGNLVTSWSNTTSNTKYPSEKLVKTSLDEKVDISSDSVLATSEYHWDIITQVAHIASRGIHYKRWICNSDGTSAFVDYRPNSDNASFMLEAYASTSLFTGMQARKLRM